MKLETKLLIYKDIEIITKPLVTYVFQDNVLIYQRPLDYKKGYLINRVV